jgi:hypothetical protein
VGLWVVNVLEAFLPVVLAQMDESGDDDDSSFSSDGEEGGSEDE